VIPNGVDFTRFILHSKAAQPRKLIYIGYLIPHKGVQVLIEALSLLKNQNFRLQLSIVGGWNIPR
jgi:glycosyltransferase involved in cell wall biosynthesis